MMNKVEKRRLGGHREAKKVKSKKDIKLFLDIIGPSQHERIIVSSVYLIFLCIIIISTLTHHNIHTTLQEHSTQLPTTPTYHIY